MTAKTKTAHSPGEWGKAHAGFERKPCIVARRAGRPVTVATFEREEDADLCVAAPAMRKALKRLLGCYDQRDSLDMTEAYDAAKEARAALKLAQGE